MNSSETVTILGLNIATHIDRDEDHEHDHDHHHDHHLDDHDDEHSHELFGPIDLVLSIFSILIAIFICFGNSVTMTAIARNVRLRTIPNMYIASLAIADLMVGIMFLVQGISGLNFVEDFAQNNENICLILMSMLFVSVTASMLSSMLVAFDRFAYIMYSIKYTQLVTRDKSLSMIVVKWLVAFAYGTVPLYTSHYNDEYECSPTHVFNATYMIIVHPLFFFTVCTVTFFLYLRIALTAVKQQKRIHDQEASVSEEQGVRKVSTKTWRVVKVLMVVFGCFFFSWCPLLVIAILEYTVHVDHDLLTVGSFIAVMNSGINFLVLGYFNKDFRSEFTKMLCMRSGKLCCQCKSSKVHPTGIITVTSNADSSAE